MYHIVLCDDELPFMEYLEGVILKAGVTGEQVRFHEFPDGEKLIRYLEGPDSKIDLMILDMCLPGMNGDQVAERFRQRFPNVILAFCSGAAKPTDRSFKVMPYRYLYKEYTDDRMLGEMREIIERMISQRSEPVIAAHCYKQQILLKTDEILYIQLAKRGCKVIVCPDVELKGVTGDLMVKEKLPVLYEKLKTFGFAYAHNSYIVNLKYVRLIKNNELIFVRWDSEPKERILSVSRSRSKELLSAFAGFLGQKY